MSNLRGFPYSMTVQSATQSDCAPLCQNLNFNISFRMQLHHPELMSHLRCLSFTVKTNILPFGLCFVSAEQAAISSDDHQHASWASLDFDTVLLVRHEANLLKVDLKTHSIQNQQLLLAPVTCTTGTVQSPAGI